MELYSKYFYFLLLLFSSSFPFVRSFENKLNYYKKWPALLIGIVLMIYGVELVEGMRGKYWEMWYFEISWQGIEFKENYMPKKYAVAILPLAGFLTTFGAIISFIKKV